MHRFSTQFGPVLFLLLAVTTTRAQTIWLPFEKAPSINSTDDFLLPLFFGSNGQKIFLTPSIATNDTFVISPKACTPPGKDTALKGCLEYRGGAYDTSSSKSYKSVTAAEGSTEFGWKNDYYGFFANGSYAEDIVSSTNGTNLGLERFDFGVVDACNMTSGFLGLGPGSTLLDRLVTDGKINSRSYGLHMGTSITNHPYPIMDPTFDDSGEKPYDKSDYNSGLGKRVADGTTPLEIHSFPGSLTLGGYDKSRIDNRTVQLKAPITNDWGLELELTEMLLRNNWMENDGIHDVFNGTRRVIIDSSTPYIYLPESTVDQLRYAMEATYGTFPEESFYNSWTNDKYIGNVSFTLRTPGNTKANITIVVPPSAFYEPTHMLRNFEPKSGSYDYFLPVKGFKDESNQPIVLGRTFLKAAHLFVNYDQKTFQLSQVSYTSFDSKTIVAVAATDTDTADVNTNPSAPPSSSDRKVFTPRPNLIPVVAGSGGVALVLLLFFGICFYRRRDNSKKCILTVHDNELAGLYSYPELGTGKSPPAQLPGGDEVPLGWTQGPTASWGNWPDPGIGENYYQPHSRQGFYEMDALSSRNVGTPTTVTETEEIQELPPSPPPPPLAHISRHELV